MCNSVSNAKHVLYPQKPGPNAQTKKPPLRKTRTAAACFILNFCLIEGAKLALAEGVTPPVYLSGNVEGGRDHNVVLEDLYLGRVKHL